MFTSVTNQRYRAILLPSPLAEKPTIFLSRPHQVLFKGKRSSPRGVFPATMTSNYPFKQPDAGRLPSFRPYRQCVCHQSFYGTFIVVRRSKDPFALRGARIDYSVPYDNSIIDVHLFTASGKTVWHYQTTQFGKGIHSANWVATTVVPGAYIVNWKASKKNSK